MTLSIESQAFTEGQPIPRRFTCEGDDVSPDLAWSGVPAGTRSFVLIVDDPDAPDPAAPKMVWDHWLLYNLPSDCSGLPVAVASTDLPSGAGEGINSWGRSGYGGPCPPIGRHRYFHRLYALDIVLEGLERPTKDRLLLAIDGHILARTELVGTYQKGDG
ncbi:Raf kinase inhibitor-like protein, YbhB/YbcL family [Thioflavicoccus mobilis 8321]|uniref:Raf kinase inhibitor-like protein, YbhB/YbcL family n=1 Tax=Thioflavicoccus mobilis 8321 TaxID=765912 RepID=L0GTQ9_9GAMM|nr:YbhB/YbcL family Raf kinase inhibitor-like protein [Thioflavicoccus mobilis]AGA90143.1 Raf kinase inhibitor-like protein, YbhB/YbcL family [Thioflavicoccus mobilis 8321]